jgi:hypothetical protein
MDLAGLAQTGSFAFTRPAGSLASGMSREAAEAVPAMTKSQSQEAMKRIWELGQGDTGGFKNWNHQWNVQEAPKFRQQASEQQVVPKAAPAAPVAPIEAPYSVINPAGFYSQGHYAATNILPEGPRSWQEMLAVLSNPQKGNVKAEEMKWAGLHPEAFDPNHKITREEIAEKFKQNFPQTDVVWQRNANQEELAQAKWRVDELADRSASIRNNFVDAYNDDWRDPWLMHELEQERLTPELEAQLRPFGQPIGPAGHYMNMLIDQRTNPDGFNDALQRMPEIIRSRAADAANAHWDFLDARQRLREMETRGQTQNAPKWESYTHDGGENYSISALTIPYNDAERLSQNIHPDIERKYAPQLNELTEQVKSSDRDYQSAINKIADEQERYERNNRPRVAEIIANVVKQSGVPESEALKIAQMRANELDWGGMALKLGDLEKVKAIQQAEAEFKNLREAKSRASYERQNIINKMREENASSVPDYTKQLYRHETHLGDVKNPLLHQRWKDRVGPNGEKIFSNEELQSDVGQQGREEGFRDPALQAQLQEARKQLATAREAEHLELSKERHDFDVYANKISKEFEEKKYQEKEKYLPPPMSDDEQKQLSSLLDKKNSSQPLSSLENKQLNYLAWKAERPLDQERVILDEFELRAHQIREDIHQKTIELSHQPSLVPGSDEHFDALSKILEEEDRLLAPDREWLKDALEKNKVNYDNAQQRLSDFNVERDKIVEAAYEKYKSREIEIKAKNDPIIRELNNKIDAIPKTGNIPLFPHVGTTDQWTELGVKHALAHAIENGYDQIFVMGGQEHARRYADGLRQAIKDVTWESPAKEIEKYYKPVTELLPDRKIVESQNLQGQKLFAVEDAEGIRDTGWEYSKENAINSFVNNYNDHLKSDALSEYYANKLYGKPVSELTGQQFDRVSSRVDQHVDDTHRLVTASSADNDGSKHTFQVDPDGKVVSSTIRQAVGKKLSEVLGGISKDVMKEDSGHIPLDNYRMNSEGYTQHYERKVPSTYKDIIKKYLKVDPKIEAGPLVEKTKSRSLGDYKREFLSIQNTEREIPGWRDLSDEEFDNALMDWGKKRDVGKKGPQGTAIHITPEMREAYHRIKKQRGSVFPAYKRGGAIEDPNDQHAMEVVRNLSRRAG